MFSDLRCHEEEDRLKFGYIPCSATATIYSSSRPNGRRLLCSSSEELIKRQNQWIAFGECWTLVPMNDDAKGETQHGWFWPICTQRAQVLGRLTPTTKRKRTIHGDITSIHHCQGQCWARKCLTTCMCSRCKSAFECTTTTWRISHTKKQNCEFLPT